MLHVFSIHEYVVLPCYGGLFKVTQFRKTSLVFMFAKRIQIDTHYTLALTCLQLNKLQLSINRGQFNQPVFVEKQSYLPVIPTTRFTFQQPGSLFQQQRFMVEKIKRME